MSQPQHIAGTMGTFQQPDHNRVTKEQELLAFHTAVALQTAFLGKADERNLERAINAIRANKHSPTGAYQRACALAGAALRSEAPLRAISNFAEKLWRSGLDLHGQGLGDDDYDPSIKNALRSEGLVLEYFPPVEMREHARALVNNLWEVLQSSSRFTEGLQSLESTAPTSLTKHRAWEDTLREFDREFISAAELLRFTVVDAFVSCDPQRINGESIVGPTVSCGNAVEALFLGELLRKLPEHLQAKVVTRASKVLSNLTMRDYLLKDNQPMRHRIACLVQLQKKLQAGLAFLGTGAKLHENQNMLRQLGAIEGSPSATLTHLTAPPRYTVLYVALHPTPERPMLVTLYHTHSMGLFELREPGKPETTQWGVDILGAIRSLQQGIPIDETDLKFSKEEFSTFSKEVQQGALTMLSKLMAIWERFPHLYTASLQGDGSRPSPLISDLVISEVNGYLSLRVARDRQHLLTVAIFGTSGSEEDFQDSLSVASAPGAEIFELHFPLTRPTKPPVLHEEIAPEPPTPLPGELSDQFISDYCPHYTDVANLLAKHFGVEERGGKGSHRHLSLNGRKYPTSSRMRDGTFPITNHFIRSVLRQLQISEDRFVRAVEG